MEHFVDYFTDSQVIGFTSNRRVTITKLNYFLPSLLYTGKYSFERTFSRYHIGFKLGQFTKNRKPFYFRSKKKKMSQKNTNYNLQLSLIPLNYSPKVKLINTQNHKQKTAHLVLLDMLQLMSM